MKGIPFGISKVRATSVATAIVGALALVAVGGQAGQAAVPRASDGGARPHVPTRTAALEAARGQLDGIVGNDQSTTVRDVIVDPNGTSHVRFDRTYKGLKVLGGDFVVHDDAQGVRQSFSGRKASSVTAMSLSTQAKVPATKAANTGARAVSYRPTTSKPTLVVDATAGAPTLAWQVHVTGVGARHEPRGDDVIVNASTGKVMRVVPTVLNEEGTGHSLYLGDVQLSTTKNGDQYEMVDPDRGQGSTYDAKNGDGSTGDLFTDPDNVWGDGTTNDPATAAVDANYGVALTWDYYKTVHDRNGIADDGKGAESYVHVGDNWFNASWSDDCFCMAYGDGDGSTAGPLVEIDIAGHEMSHGVTSRTANLEYSGESGGLNEATSDIMGTSVEWFANNSEDTPDYVMGEEIFTDYDPATNYIRRMDTPSMDGQSADCWDSSVGDLDVHYSSGVANHFFYLLSEGSGQKTINDVAYDSPTCDGSTITGIGHEKAADIWYKALTAYMTSTTDYHGARDATLSAAKDLYGADSAEYQAVDATWKAVGVEASS